MTDRIHEEHSHAHGVGATLEPAAHDALVRGLSELLKMTEGLEFRATKSERNPLPLSVAAYRSVPSPAAVRRDIMARLNEDPVSVLEYALALLELYECNQADTAGFLMEDGPFLEACFTSKRRNGWIAFMGAGDRAALQDAISARWQFNFHSGPARPTGIYVLLSMLARYGYVYGKIPFGDAHALSHFVEDFTPGVIVASGAMSGLELALSLAAMKMGVPAVVPPEYPFPLGRTVRASSPGEIVEAVVRFPNVRRLLPLPGMPQMPAYASAENVGETFAPAAVWGDTPESFYILRKGAVARPGKVEVAGKPAGPMGVLITVDAEPMDAFDRRYIERQIANSPSMISGVLASYDGQRLVARLREPDGFNPARIAEVMVAALRKEYPRIERVSAEVIFDVERLRCMAPQVEREKRERADEMASTTEESSQYLYSCVGCSPFAPYHVCIVTPERPPQCARPYEMIKTGAHYAYDDMTNIHHSVLHRDVNSFGVIDKGRCLDAARGEWEGVNSVAASLTGGRTTRIQLHCVGETPTTGCGCFRLIMFQTTAPARGIAIMDAGYEGRCPDGRSWRDLHYALAGKQTPGVSGASGGYLSSKKFLAAHGGWSAVVWVSPRVAELAGDRLPRGVRIG